MTFRWPTARSPPAAFLHWPSALLARVAAAISWQWWTQRRRRLEAPAVKEHPPADDAGPATQPQIIHVLDPKGVYISGGTSGIVELLPSGHAVKSPWPHSPASSRRDIALESRIYAKLGRHPRLVQIIDWDPEGCALTMEYMPHGTLADYLAAHTHTDTISPAQRLQWAQEAAEGLQLLHAAGVVHCDVEPKNFLLDANLSLKIADFGGSSFEGAQATACVGRKFRPADYDWRYVPTVQDDLFALGSTIYCIMAGQEPFEELSDGEVEDWYKAGKFPDLAEIVCGDIILRCWKAEVASSQEVYDFFEGLARTAGLGVEGDLTSAAE